MKRVVVLVAMLVLLFGGYSYNHIEQTTFDNLGDNSSLTVILNDNFEPNFKSDIAKRYEESFKYELQKLSYPKLNITVKVMSNEAAIKAVSKSENTIAFVDSTDYIAQKQFENNLNTKVLASTQRIKSDANANPLYNQSTDFKQIYLGFNKTINPEFQAMTSIESIDYTINNNRKIGIGSNLYDASKIWLYNYCIENKLDYTKLKLVEYPNEKSKQEALNKRQIDFVISSNAKYNNPKTMGYTVFNSEDNSIKALSEIIIGNDNLNHIETRKIENLLYSLYKNGAIIKNLSSAYGTINIVPISGYKTQEDQAAMSKAIEKYNHFLEDHYEQ